MSLRLKLLCLALLALSITPGGRARPAPRPFVAVLVDEYGSSVEKSKRELYRSVVSALETGVDAELRIFSFERDKERINLVLREARDARPAAVIALGVASLKIMVKNKDAFDCPIIFCGVLNPQRYLGPDDRDICGTSINVDPSVVLRYAKRNLPGVRSVGIVYDGRDVAAQVDIAAKAAKTLGIDLIARQAGDLAEAVKGVDSLEERPVDIFLVLPDRLVKDSRLFNRMRQASVRQDIMIVVPNLSLLQDDGLLCLEFDGDQVGRDSAILLRRVLAGVNPEELGIVHTRNPRVMVNVRIARSMRVPLTKELQKAEKIE